MGNFEKLSVVVIVVIIVMILAVAVVEWTSSPSESTTTERDAVKADALPVVPSDMPKVEKAPKAKTPLASKPAVTPTEPGPFKEDPWVEWRGLGGKDELTAKSDKLDGKGLDGKGLDGKALADGEKKPDTPTTPAPASTDIPESTYVVGEGDSLSLIAQKVWRKASLWPLIAEANPSVRPESLRKGETLKIPARKNVASAAAVGDMPTNGTKPVPGKEYTVQANDTWERISLAAYNTSARWPEIYVKNIDRVSGMKDLAKGKVLMIPR